MIFKKDKSAKTLFSAKEKKGIANAIREAELETSGEIRLHVENNCSGDVFTQAKKVFYALGMDKTELKNAVLFYIAVKDKKFAIVADKGINDAVPANFWENIKEKMKRHFAGGNYFEGVCEAIEITGEKLKTYFPRSDDDRDELSNEISIGE